MITDPRKQVVRVLVQAGMTSLETARDGSRNGMVGA